MNTGTKELRTSTSTCDDCGRQAPGVEHFNHDASVSFVCKGCDPATFEKRSRCDIDQWLSGDNL